ncbi:MAG: HD domain-containing protein [Spirochaetaceae bacterium]|jgi:GTP pyrophosphokinase|nr:HD domain-containing protein [Spirochaetaceae bacterium]
MLTKDFSGEDRRRIEKALTLCGNERCKGTAEIVVRMRLDADCVIAALLFDSYKTGDDKKNAALDFGGSAASLIEGAAKALKLSTKDKSIAEAEKIRKMLFAMIEDIRVIFICLAEKLQIMRTIDRFPEEERKGIAQECLDVYAPLAHRLGISWLKDEIEDLCLECLNPDVFRQITDIVALKHSEREHFLDFMKSRVEVETKKRGIKADVKSRAKHFYSIYQKMRKRGKEAGDLYDLFGLRVLCDTVENCYALLGLIHTLWMPVDGRFKDYIAMPKSNGYQSLHTTVLAFDDEARDSGGVVSGNMIEIQIRTFDMHEAAEYGYASHWLYKKGMNAEYVHEKDLPLVNRLMRITRGIENSAIEYAAMEYSAFEEIKEIKEIKKEILKDSIFVFTPQGKVIELPQGATPIDFAYSIHTAIGEHCHAAKADGAIIPLNKPLQNTQIVEIITAQNAHPHSNWERIVKTAKARSKIRAWLALNDAPIQHEKSGQHEKSAAAKKKQEEPVRRGREHTRPSSDTRPAAPAPMRVLIQHEKNMLFRFAKCCDPKPPDEITGYVSRGRGIIIHRKDCASIPNITEFNERRIDAEWEAPRD